MSDSGHSSSAGQARAAVARVAAAVAEMGFSFRETVSDAPFDGVIDVVDSAGATGRPLRVEIRTPLRQSGRPRSEIRHQAGATSVELWSTSSLPVVLVLVDADSSLMVFRRVDDLRLGEGATHRTISLDPDDDVFDATSAARLLQWAFDSDDQPSPSRHAMNPSDGQSLSHPPVSLRELVPALRAVDRLADGSASLVTATAEKLLMQVRLHLQNGSWAPENGFPLGLEEDVQGDANELERQLRPLSGRQPRTLTLQGLVVGLSESVLELEAHLASDEERQRILSLKESVVDRIAAFDGSSRDLDGAIEAMEALAFATSWNNISAPDDSLDEAWSALLQDSASSPARLVGLAVGWLPRSGPAGAAAALGSMTSIGGISVVTNAVVEWIGLTGSSAAALSGAGSLVGAAIGAVLGVVAARYIADQ